jgi:hypothetical protein
VNIEPQEPDASALTGVENRRSSRRRRRIIRMSACFAFGLAFVGIVRSFGGPELPTLNQQPLETAAQAALPIVGTGTIGSRSWTLRVAGDGGQDPTWHLVIDGRTVLTDLDGAGEQSGGEFRLRSFGKPLREMNVRVHHVVGMPKATDLRLFGEYFASTTTPAIRVPSDTSDGWFVVVIDTAESPVIALHVLDADGAVIHKLSA